MGKKKSKARSSPATAGTSTRRRGTNNRKATAAFSDVAEHGRQLKAIRDAKTGARLSEHEHIRARVNLQSITRNPRTGISPYDQRAYRHSHTLTIPRDMALEKTALDMRLHRNIVAGQASVEDLQIHADVDRTIAARDVVRRKRIAAGLPTDDLDRITDTVIQRAAHYQQGELFKVGKEQSIDGLTQQDIDDAFERWAEGETDLDDGAKQRASEPEQSRDVPERKPREPESRKIESRRATLTPATDATPASRPAPRPKDVKRATTTDAELLKSHGRMTNSQHHATDPARRGTKYTKVGTDGFNPKAKSPLTLKGAIPEPAMPRISPSVKLRPSVGRLAVGIAKGLLIGVLQDLAIGLFVSYFENKVTAQTNRLVRNALKRDIFPKFSRTIEKEMKRSLAGEQSERNPKYIGFTWYLVTRELDEDFSDVIVYLGKFAAGDPGFGEVYERVEPEHDDYKNLLHSEAEIKGVAHKRRRVPGADNLWRQGFLTWILVHDPIVAKAAQTLRRNGEEQLAMAATLYGKSEAAFGENIEVARRVNEITDALEKFRLKRATEVLAMLRGGYLVFEESKTRAIMARIDELARSIQKSWEIVYSSGVAWSSERCNLLDTLVGRRLRD